MRIVSWNVNGVRAWAKRGGLDWLAERRPDVFCLQETKATEDQVSAEDRARLGELGYHCYWHSAARAGYSGVATFSLERPLFVTKGVRFERDEGSVIVTEHGGFTLYNVYFPNGRQREDGPDPERIAFKLEFYDLLLEQVEEERGRGEARDRRRRLEHGPHGDRSRATERERRPDRLFTDRARGPAALGRRRLGRYVSTLSPGVQRTPAWSRASDRTRGGRIAPARVTATSVGASTTTSSIAELLPRVRGAEIWSEVLGSDHAPVVVDVVS